MLYPGFILTKSTSFESVYIRGVYLNDNIFLYYAYSQFVDKDKRGSRMSPNKNNKGFN